MPSVSARVAGGCVQQACGDCSRAARRTPPVYAAECMTSCELNTRVKKIGFLSFGHWSDAPGSQVRSGVGLAAAVDRACRRGGRARRGRRLLPGAPLRAAARLAVPAARGGGRADEADRDRHRRHRHALREPALHGRGRRAPPTYRRRPAAARHQPRLTRAGHRRLAVLRLPAGRRQDRRRHGAGPRRGVPRGAEGRGLRAAEPAADVPQPARPAARRAALAGAARAHLVGRRLAGHGAVGGAAWA